MMPTMDLTGKTLRQLLTELGWECDAVPNPDYVEPVYPPKCPVCDGFGFFDMPFDWDGPLPRCENCDGTGYMGELPKVLPRTLYRFQPKALAE